MKIDLSFVERIMIAECIRFRKLSVQVELLSASPEDFPDGVYDEFQHFVRCAPHLIDRLLSEPDWEEEADREEEADSFPVGYPGGDLEEWQRQADGAFADQNF